MDHAKMWAGRKLEANIRIFKLGTIAGSSTNIVVNVTVRVVEVDLNRTETKTFPFIKMSYITGTKCRCSASSLPLNPDPKIEYQATVSQALMHVISLWDLPSTTSNPDCPSHLCLRSTSRTALQMHCFALLLPYHLFISTLPAFLHPNPCPSLLRPWCWMLSNGSNCSILSLEI